MKHSLMALAALVLALVLAACGSPAPESGQSTEDAAFQNLYKTTLKNTGEDESTQKYLEIAQRSAKLLPLLEKDAGAFVCDAYNFQTIDEDGAPLYTLNKFSYPQEIAPNGQSIRVSKNYFRYNPIETADGSALTDRIVVDDLTLNVLVPEKYREMEDQIVEAYRKIFYFEKVEAENSYNEMAGIADRLDLPEESLQVNLIYVKDGQRYFTFRSDCAATTDNWITDPVVQIYTSNLHCSYAHSFLSQWTYFHSDKENAEEAYQDIAADVEACGAEESLQRVLPYHEDY